MGRPERDRRAELSRRILAEVDPRLSAALLDEYERAVPSGAPLSDEVCVVLVGHRAAGKSRLLPLIAALLDRPSVDLDHVIEVRHGRAIREWVSQDEPGFRRAERDTFHALPARTVIAAGGGFLAHHADALTSSERRNLAVLVPVSFETYCERLRADTTRPRLRPDLSLEDELHEIFHERERQFSAGLAQPLPSFLRTAEADGTP